MKALVTGGTGFVGSHVVEELLRKGIEVRCLVRPTSNKRWLSSLNVEYVNGSLNDSTSLQDAVVGVDYVIHVAGLTSARSREEFFQGNQVGTRNLVHAVREYNPTIKRFLCVSSLAAVGPAKDANTPVTEDTAYHPITTYGESKRAAEDEVLAVQDFPWTIVRPPAVYGPRDSAVLTFFQSVHKGILPLIGFDKKLVSLVHVHDLARGIVEATLFDQSIGKDYFISSDEFYTWDQIGDVTAAVMNKRRPMKLRVPHPLVMVLAGVSQFFGKFQSKPPVLDFEKGRDIVQPFWICSTEKARRDFGYTQQMSLKDGVQNTVDWYKNEGWL